MVCLVLVRHGESTANRDRLVPGRVLGAELTDLGVRQARLAAEQVARLAAEAFRLNAELGNPAART